MEAKRCLRNNIILPSLTYVSEILTCNTAQHSRIRAVETSYVRVCVGVSRPDEEDNENLSI